MQCAGRELVLSAHCTCVPCKMFVGVFGVLLLFQFSSFAGEILGRILLCRMRMERQFMFSVLDKRNQNVVLDEVSV